MTVIVGRPIASGNDCRIITTASLSQDDVTFTLPAPPTEEQYDNKETRINLPTPSWAHYVQGVVALMNRGSPGIPPFEAVVATCVPLGGGVSSSAALEVTMCLFVESLCCHIGVTMPTRTNEVCMKS